MGQSSIIVFPYSARTCAMTNNRLNLDGGIFTWFLSGLFSYSDMDFQHIHRLLHDDDQHTIAHPFAITVFGDYIYFTDWNLKGVFKAHKYKGEDVRLRSTVHRPFDIQIVHPLRQNPSKLARLV